MRIETATRPGTPERPNEDFTAVALPASGEGGVLVVLDGVTPPPAGTGCVHGVPWFTARLGGALLELAAARPGTALADCLTEAIARTAGSHASSCDLSHRNTPQATVVAARWNRDVVEHLVLSDSVLLIEDTTGRTAEESVRAVLDDRLGRLPEPVRAMRAAVRALPPGSPERAVAGAEYGRAVEALRNAEGGFFTAAADPSVAARAVTGATPRADVRSLTALTDGASRLVEVFHECGWGELVEVVRAAGPEEVIRRVRAAEAADPSGTRFPRGKRHDDATVTHAALGVPPVPLRRG
ncbi:MULTISPECIES: hypothetical protein [Streptomycetaceae]|uniref:Protein phosphatase 2C n=1 Tax=Streptantibioticus cattleyicolor (strain ATCC 35852 / DSM 46488 / JCM 4925 / NBRC 14057 / NRRL 8057) TaxID=1003195 RepID=F8JPE1_STREN|nr:MULTISPECIES: hypothetical protein [Streptomycetaceae]AEW96493.1 hypothetical protein SCATT_41220 [Streptantibioticus cattleyicolor NRRL 8057 = DSM 46488]MYS60996.1 hypothetical protein [Streptomyces sp. SID5468]CCB76828.1 conserved protein of unknown function [Streptantibioticus cattleyicolor NRRL 8057 = DSM 46488]